MKSGSLKLLAPSGQQRAYYGTALPLPFIAYSRGSQVLSVFWLIKIIATKIKQGKGITQYKQFTEQYWRKCGEGIQMEISASCKLWYIRVQC